MANWAQHGLEFGRKLPQFGIRPVSPSGQGSLYIARISERLPFRNRDRPLPSELSMNFPSTDRGAEKTN